MVSVIILVLEIESQNHRLAVPAFTGISSSPGL